MGPYGGTAVGGGQEGPIPGDAPLGEMRVPAGMLLWRAGSGSPGIPSRCVAGKSREAGPWGREGTDAGPGAAAPPPTCRWPRAGSAHRRGAEPEGTGPRGAREPPGGL